MKSSFVTGLLRRYVFRKEEDVRIIKDVSEIRERGFEDAIEERLRPYNGRSRESLIVEFGLNQKSKDVNERIVAAILRVKGKVSETAEFRMANILPKTVRIDKKGSIKESMSFKAFRAREIAGQRWEESELKELFESSRFMFIIFRVDDDGGQVFEGIRFWNMPPSEIEEVEKVWTKTARIIREGVKFVTVNGRIGNNLPKSSENPVAHVRPHARDSSDTDELPDGRTMTKQCFWLNRQYVMRILRQYV